MTLLAVVSCVELQNGQDVGATTSAFTGSATDLVAQLLLMLGIEQHCGKHDAVRVSHELLLDAGQPAQQSVGTDTRRPRRRRDPRSPFGYRALMRNWPSGWPADSGKQCTQSVDLPARGSQHYLLLQLA